MHTGRLQALVAVFVMKKYAKIVQTAVFMDTVLYLCFVTVPSQPGPAYEKFYWLFVLPLSVFCILELFLILSQCVYPIHLPFERNGWHLFSRPS